MFSPGENLCRRFQANIFNKRKCQNCFRTLDSHTFTQSDLQTAKPVKAGWLLLAPEGIDFLNPAHKNRKWQRRYFKLYENGLLCFSLDEMPGTLAQGNINMSQCSDILDASSYTSYCKSLRLCFRDRDYYIRSENSDHITGWQEKLLVQLKAAKTNCRKRRREPSLSQHNQKRDALPERNQRVDDNNYILNPSWSIGSRSAIKQKSSENRNGSNYSSSSNKSVNHEDLNIRTGAEGTEWISEKGDDQSSSRISNANSSSISVISSYLANLCQPSDHISTNTPKSREGLESGYSSLEKTRLDPEDAQTRRSQVISQFESENETHSTSTLSIGSSAECDQDERATRNTKLAFTGGQHASASSPNNRRSKSLERGLAEHTSTPDLLHFKKGWMTKLGEDGKWRKHWFVLTNQSLRFYRDSVAEEAADLDGEINLSTCFNITDFPVQRNYGFQIQTKDGAFTLCAMTSGIRRNWMKALVKNVFMSVIPDLMCVSPQTVPMGMVSDCKSPFASDPVRSDMEKRSSIAERRKEGHYKTFDWAEFSHMKKKRETFGRQSRIDSEFVHEDSAPSSAPSSEELVAKVAMLTHSEMAQDSHSRTADSSLHVRSVIFNSKRAERKSAHADGRDVDDDLFNEQKEKKQKTKPSPSSATFSSLSVQTECQWDPELQTLYAELQTENEKITKEVREYKLSEAHLQAKLKNSQDCLRETESTLRKTVATLRKRENALEELQGCLEDVSRRLKATEEAQALKDVRIQRHVRLIEESQERERRSLSDRLEHAEKRGKELEERLRQTEAMLQKMPTASMVEQSERKCQELQNQLDESDSELSRLQARLRNEETLYYDLEHNYEQVCEEMELLRGTLENCEKICEERCRIQLEEQREMLNRKEQELQAAFPKIGCLSTTSERSDIFQPHAFNLHPMESQMNKDKDGILGKQSFAQGDESEQVISVIQALESKLCDTEERLQEITVHLQQQQQKHGDNVNTCTNGDHWSLQKTNTSLGMGTGDGKHCGVILEKTEKTSERFGFDLQEALQDKSTSPDEFFCQRMTNRMLSLEAVVIQRMAALLAHPTKHFIDGLSELQSQTKARRETYDGQHEESITKNYSRLFSDFQEMCEEGCSLNECVIYSLCMKAELAYLMYTNHLHKLDSERGSQAFIVPFCLGSEVKPCTNKEVTSSKSGFWLPVVSLPELVPCENQARENLEYPQGILNKDSLVVELQTQARSLQALSKQLYPLDENAISLSEFSPVLQKTILFQAVLAYVTCKLHVDMQRQMRLLEDQIKQADCHCCGLEAVLQERTKHYGEKLREDRVIIEVAELARASAETDAQINRQELQNLDAEFKKKLQEHQQIHEEKMARLHEYRTQNQATNVDHPELSVTALKERICELELHIRSLEAGCHRADVKTLGQAYEEELETLKATCELGFSSMEQSHQRVIEEMQRQHQLEVEQLLEEKNRVLQEETNATISAIEAMRKAHKEELEKTQKVQQSGTSADIHKLRAQVKDELDSLHRELEVLSEQYSQKCLENAHLSRTIENERQALNSVEREKQELHTRNRELNKCLVAELSLMQSCVHREGKQAEFSQSKDIIQLEVALRVKESEMQCLKQEISSLKEELQAAHRCKKLLNKLSLSGVSCHSTFDKRCADTCRNRSQSCDVMKSRSNPDLMKNCTKPKPPIRSKSLGDYLSVQERMKLFESDIK